MFQVSWGRTYFGEMRHQNPRKPRGILRNSPSRSLYVGSFLRLRSFLSGGFSMCGCYYGLSFAAGNDVVPWRIVAAGIGAIVCLLESEDEEEEFKKRRRRRRRRRCLRRRKTMPRFYLQTVNARKGSPQSTGETPS